MAHTIDKDGNVLGFERDDNNFGRNREDLPIHGEQPLRVDEDGRHSHPDNTDPIPDEQINID